MKNKQFFLFSEYYKNKIKPNSIEHAYLLILKKDFINANIIFEKNISPRGFWGSVVSNIFQNKDIKNPTFFQINNFLEIDINFFIKNNINDLFMENLVNYINLFLEINCFTYKYLGRVFYANNYYEKSREYLLKSLYYCYNDIEVHFLLAKLYLLDNDVKSALDSVNICLDINKEYFPAKKILKKIEEKNF